MTEICLELKDIRKSFVQEEEVLKGISLKIARGEFITLLGASGCGKTTTLRIIAGLESPDAGQVFLEGRDVTDLPPEKRDVNTVFQNYALFPHMNVADNIGYGLKLKKMPKSEIRKRVDEMLELVQLSGYGKRKPSELSGGQRQRVAIARALINNPKVLLLDEPLGALDLKLRRAMQLELKKLQKKLGITFIYITHDQEEAINMSDRIAVMNNGVFEQIGTPDEVYNHPDTSYVATFVGNANILKGKAVRMEGSGVLVALAGGEMYAEACGTEIKPGETVTLSVRSENILFEAEGQESVTDAGKQTGFSDTEYQRGGLYPDNQPGLEAEAVEKSFAGGMLRVVLRLKGGTEVVASRYGIDASIEPGQKVRVYFAPENAVPVDRPETGKGIKNAAGMSGEAAHE